MSEQHALLADTADKVFAALSGDFAADWRAVADAGLAAVMVPEAQGGFGGGFEDAHMILHAAGRHATALPMAEAILAARLLAESGVATAGALTLTKDTDGSLENGGFTGTLSGVACGEDCAHVIAIVAGHVVSLACRDAEVIERHSDPADTPYLTLRFAKAPAAAAPTAWTAHRLFHAMALARASQIGGAITAALELAATHVNQREQFGRPLAKFQAIQQQMAVLAEEDAAATAAARAAACAADCTADGGEADFPIACAKLRANRAAGEAASIAHQVHGAIGFTREYDLQRFTRRLWAWRSEYGNERHWANLLGGQVARQGADGFWPGLVANFAG